MGKEDTMNFTELKINEKILKGINAIGFEEMMPIQEQTIPVILEGKNIIGEAETGTGKTAAFVVPILDKIDFKSKQTECIIVTPTRELAIQIVSEIEKIGKYLKPSYATIVGGMSIRDQERELRKNPSIIVGTLGRINDFLRGRKIDLRHIKYFILDEADEMLKEGFKEDIDAINAQIPITKQTLLFSATISKEIKKLSKGIMDDYEFISVKSKEKISTNIDQYYITMKEKNKFKTLTKLLDIDNPKCAIIFGRTKRRADELSEALNTCGYAAVGLHGDLSQAQRNAVMKKFKEKKINILVATDVAARGLDISGVSHVYNFDLPQEVEFYVHRIGRTGRAKMSGISISFIKENEIEHIRRIEREANVIINEKMVPTSEDVWAERYKYINKSIKKRLKEIDTSKTNEFAKTLIDEFGSEKLVSVLIESLSNKIDINNISLTGEPPVVVRGRKSSGRGERNYHVNRRRNDRGNDRGNREGRNNRRSNGGRRNDRKDNNRRRNR